MLKLASFADRFNSWYDRLPEPQRFAAFIVPMAMAVFPLQLGIQFENRLSTIFGLLMFTLMSTLAATRAHRMGGAHRYLGCGLLVGLAIVGLGVVF